MCRLLGIIANKTVDLEFSLTGGGKAFRDFGRQNPDGWGMGWYEGGAPQLHKEPVSATRSPELPRLAHSAHSALFLCHVRYATHGLRNVQNCHPFSSDDWLFAHNGSVSRDPLWAQLEKKRRERVKGSTDSEVCFHWILQNIDHHDGDVVEGLRSALEFLDAKGDYSAVNFILSDGHNLYAYRDATVNQNYYSLNYLSRDPSEPFPLTLESEVGALLSSKLLRGERALLVSSETLTDEPWKEIPLGFLLRISSDLEPELEKIR